MISRQARTPLCLNWDSLVVSNSPIFSLDRASGARQQPSLEPQHHLPAYSQHRSLKRGFGTGPGTISSSGSLLSKQVDAKRGRATQQPRGRGQALPGSRASTLSAQDASRLPAPGLITSAQEDAASVPREARGEIKRLPEPLLNPRQFA